MKPAQEQPFFDSRSGAEGTLPVTPRASSLFERNAEGREIVLVDELPLRRASVLSLLTSGVGAEGRPCGSMADALGLLPAERDDLLGVVIYKDGRGVLAQSFQEDLRNLCQALQGTPVIILSDCEEPEAVIAAFHCGARGYIPTSLEPRLVIGAVELTLSGSSYLPVSTIMRWRRDGRARPARQADLPEALPSTMHWPPRELAVLRHLVLGKANKEIALALMIEVSTVKVHIRHITRKLGVANRTQAALRARRMGIGVCASEAQGNDWAVRKQRDGDDAEAGLSDNPADAHMTVASAAAYTSSS